MCKDTEVMKNATSKVEQDSKECFVIMPIADQDGYDLGHFGRVYEDLFLEAIVNAGFSPMRADKVTRANNIHVDILNRLRKAPIAICDISARNPNVFFELAFRQAFDMPTVILKDEKTQSPFDIISIRYVDYDSRLRYRDVVAKRAEITRFIADTYADPQNNSLISLLSIGEKASVLESKSSPEMAAIELLAGKVDKLVFEVDKYRQSQSGNIGSKHINLISNLVGRAITQNEIDSINKSINSIRLYGVSSKVGDSDNLTKFNDSGTNEAL